MMRISIGLSYKTKSFFSWLIRLYQKTKYSHTYIRIETRTFDLILDATSRGVSLKNYKDFTKNNNIIEEKILDQQFLNEDDFASIVIPLLGKKYGYITILGILLKNFGIKGIGKDGNKSFICSELVARVLEKYIGIDTGTFDYITPKDIELLLELL